MTSTGRPWDRPRRRVAALTVVVALGALAGAFAVGRWSASGDQAAPPATAPLVTATVPLTSVPLASPLSNAVPTTVPTDPAALRPLSTVGIDDVVIRLFERDAVPRSFQVWPGWTPPPSCLPTREVVLQASGPRWVTQFVVSRDGSRALGAETVVVEQAGREEGDPTWLVAAAVPDASQSVTVRSRDGAVVQALVVDGVALAVRHSGDTGGDDADMQPTVLALAGTDVALDDLWDRLDPPPCRPPLLLMPRRADVPVTDPAATAAIVNDLLDTLVGRRGFQALVKATDSPQLIVSVEPQLARFAILGEYVVHPDDWVFTSPNRIVVRYDLFSVPGNERTYWSRFAVLVRRGDTWKLTEDSVCEFVLLGSAACPGWTSDRGPTAQAVAGTL